MSTGNQTVNRSAVLQRWLPYCRPETGQPGVRLLCFSHAGGSALAFRTWPEKFPWNIQVCAVQLPGRENRLREPYFRRIPELMERLSEEVLHGMDGPVALLGHSMGAKIAFESARRLRSRYGPQKVVHLFVSGCSAPHLSSGRDPIYTLPDDKFLERLADFGGTPQDVLANREIMQFLAPRLRADFELDDTYPFVPDTPLECPITAWTGDADDMVPQEAMEAWREHTQSAFSGQVLQGGHFAFYEQENTVLAQVRRALSARPETIT